MNDPGASKQLAAPDHVSRHVKKPGAIQRTRSNHHTGALGSPAHGQLLSHQSSSKNAISKLSIEVVSQNEVKNSISRTAMDMYHELN